MKLLLPSVVFLLQVLQACSDCAPGHTVTGLVGGQAILPCIYEVTGPVSLTSARLYWQFPPKKVAYAFLEGKPEEQYVESHYRGRTTVPKTELIRGNFSLQLNNLTVKDDVEYHCYFFLNNRKAYECQLQLHIAAPYQPPVLSASRGESLGAGLPVNLSCHSFGGFPAPVVNWTDDAGRPLGRDTEVNTSVEQDPVSGLYNVTSSVRIIAAVGTSVRCSVFNSRIQQRLDSIVWAYTSSNTSLPFKAAHPQYLIILYVSAAVIVCVCFVVAILCTRSKRYRGVRTVDRQNHIKVDSSATGNLFCSIVYLLTPSSLFSFTFPLSLSLPPSLKSSVTLPLLCYTSLLHPSSV
ncbi:CD276 antigen-like [Rhincodon typus]|uniref:CD276 antigen-like n=1 Tax=Rhincodon typus TaxID=259920 RepID=UPI002030D68D|nr:CD276 antigen-like [Rhincodon typus]